MSLEPASHAREICYASWIISHSLSLSLSVLAIVSPPLTLFMSQRQDVYSSAKLPAVLIIPAQAAAGGVGCLSGQPSSAADGCGAGHGEG